MDPLDASASKELYWDDQCIGKEERTMQVDISWEAKTEASQSFLKWLENLERGVSIRSGAVAVLRANIGSGRIVCLYYC